MAQILFFVSTNVGFHAELQSGPRKLLLAELNQWLQAFENSGLPILLSMQGIDAALAGINFGNFGLDWCHAPYSHLLPSMFEGTTWEDHVAWNFGAGTFPYHNTDITFSAEFDIPRETAELVAPTVFLALPHPMTVVYADKYLLRGQKLDERCALYYGETGQHVVVPMVGTIALGKAFQTYQRTMQEADLASFVSELELLCRAPGDLPFVFLMDMEAALIGSHHGLAVWENIFEAINYSDLTTNFINANEATRVWRAQAEHAASMPTAHFSREIGSKWLAMRPQLEFLRRILASRPPHSDAEHRAVSLFTHSDYYATIVRRLRADVVLASDKGPLTIGHDETIIQVSELALKAWEEGRNIAEALRLGRDDETNNWYFNALANAIGRKP